MLIGISGEVKRTDAGFVQTNGRGTLAIFPLEALEAHSSVSQDMIVIKCDCVLAH